MVNLDSFVASLICKYKTIYLDLDHCQLKNYLVKKSIVLTDLSILFESHDEKMCKPKMDHGICGITT